MSKARVEILEGVANLYPKGGSGDGKQGKAGDHFEVDTDAHHKTKDEEKGSLKESMQQDMNAPAAGVASAAPKGERAGILQVSVSKGTIRLRVYHESTFREQQLAAGEKFSVPVTETNKLTIALYPATLP